jgi:uridine monophosphate synthetase
MVADEYSKVLKTLKYDLIVGVPYTGIPIATALALKLNEPMLFTRKEIKEHGTGRQIEGVYKKGQKAVIIDDVISDGASKIEHMEPLESEGLKVKDIVVLLDRGQGGPEIMKERGYRCHCISDIDEMLVVLRRNKKIDDEMVQKAKEFMAAARTS